MKRALVVLALLSVSAFGQTNVSPSLPGDVLPIVLEDYLGFVPAPPRVVIVAQSQTSSVVAAWNVTNAIPSIGEWAGMCSATNYAAALERKRINRADIGGQHSALSVEEKAIGMTTIALINGRLSNLVVVLNQKMGLTGTNRITAASIGGVITPHEASQLLQGYLP